MANDANTQTTSVIGWNHDADAAFSQARATARPVFLYWGAMWCPPCNRLKAAVLSQPGFATLASSFVPLHIDGDAPGAQRSADRLQLRSYPTLVLYRPDGTEITRLPCELTGPGFLHLLQLALATLVAVIFFAERPSGLQWAGIGLGIAAVAMIVWPTGGRT